MRLFGAPEVKEVKLDRWQQQQLKDIRSEQNPERRAIAEAALVSELRAGTPGEEFNGLRDAIYRGPCEYKYVGVDKKGKAIYKLQPH